MLGVLVFSLCVLHAADSPVTSPPHFHYDTRAEGWQTSGGFDMPAAVVRYTTDRQTLERYYNNRFSPERRQALDQFAANWMEVLEQQVPYDSLDVNGRIDWLLLRAKLHQYVRSSVAMKKRESEIARLVPFADSILALDDDLRRFAFVDGADAAARVSRLADELGRLTSEITNGKLTAPSTAGRRAARFTESLRETLKQWRDFYTGYDPVFTWWVAEPWKRADAALGAYATLLDEKIAGVRSSDKDTIVGDPVGREAVEDALASEFIPYTPEELIAIGRKEFAWCKEQMLACSRQLGYGDDWRKALDHVKNDHVKPGQQPALIRDLAYEAVDYVRRHDLITIPDAATNTWRMEMMSPERQRMNPFFLGGDTMIVSYPTDTMTEEQKLMSMRGNNIHFARATVFHELIPGHYLQQYMAERYRPWRSAFETPFWVEGWAFYWEMLLWDLDFPRSPEDRIGMLFWRMHRAARVIFSLSFHLGQMTAPQAVDFLVNEVGHERENAAGEVRRSFESNEYGPLYQCAYQLGALQFRALRAELVDAGKMTNRQFHDAVLKLNAIPVEMIRVSLMNQKLAKGFAAQWKFYAEVPPGKSVAAPRAAN
ncbi:MAG TPA: DUF885 domain-containing protein [Bryobacteraceae bacterium]|nr:DUF885 domain-containing protein [Bryobacteraceae bacterium]